MVEALNPARCQHCLMHLRLCVCSLMPRVANTTQLVLLIHHREIKKPTNTGGLAARCLQGSEIHISGRKDQPIDYTKLVREDASNLLLFPSESVQLLTPEFCAALTRPVRLIVPDGNWGQARRMRRKIPENFSVTPIALPQGAPSQYRLRREAKELPDGLATLEAIARALAVIEGPTISEPLLEIFRVVVERILWSKGKLPADQVYRGIPDKPS